VLARVVMSMATATLAGGVEPEVSGLAERPARVNSGTRSKALVGGAGAEFGESVRTKMCSPAIAGEPVGLPPV